MKNLLTALIICACMVNPDEGVAQTVITDNHGKPYVYQFGNSRSVIIGNEVIIRSNPQSYTPTLNYTPKQERPYQWRCEISNGCVPNSRRDSWDD